MKTITHGLFIYVSLTTIYLISAVEPYNKTISSPVKSKCELPDIIKASENLEEKCKKNFTTETLPPELDSGNLIPYLCTGILETANIMCELNLNPPAINTVIFEADIKDLQPKANNLTTFCTAMNRAVSNSTYKSLINSTAHPNIVKLNKNLVEGCRKMCWKTIGETSASYLCTVLLWENEIIADAKIPGKHLPTKPPAKALETETKSSDADKQKGELELISGHVIPPAVSQPGTNGVIDSPAKGQVGDVIKEDVDKPKANQEKTPALVTEAAEHDLDKKDQHQLLQNANIPSKEKQDIKDVTEAGNSEKTQKGSKAGSRITEKTDIEKAEDNEPDDKMGHVISTDEKVGGNKKLDADFDENSKNTEDDGDDDEAGIHDNMDKPPFHNEKKPASYPANEIPASSNDESTAPRDHSLTHSGPLDPPQHFFAYFMAVSFICLLCYIGYHKKHKIMAIIFEGRKSRSGRGRRRPNTAGYRKLDCNLEEAVTSQCNSNKKHVPF